MPEWLLGQGDELGQVVAKAALMYVVALVGLRVAHRRTLSQWTAIDFATGATALITLLASHWAVTMARYHGWLTHAVDHRVRVLLDHGQLRRDQMKACGLTNNDVLSKLRERGVADLSELRYVLYETKGELTLVPEPGAHVPDSPLVRSGLDGAAAWPPRS